MFSLLLAIMGLFNRNKQQPQEAAATEAVATKAATQLPSSPDKLSADHQSLYSEATKSRKREKSDDPDDDVVEDDENEDEEFHKVTEWDEGGASHCGYSEGIHETLMTVGGSVHGVVGDPPQAVERKMNTVANWFQEMSYAIRDFWRGQSSMSEDIQDVMNSVMNSDSQEEKDGDENNDPPSSSNTPVATQS